MELQNVLSEERQTEQVEQVEQTEQQVTEATGETSAAPPAESKDDAIETHRKGLEAATVAERQRRQAAEARAAQLEAELAKFQKQQQPKAEDGAPDPAQYQDNPQQYWRDLARYEARQELHNAVRQAQEQAKVQKQAEEQQAIASRLNTLVMAGQAKYQDFDAAINSGLAPFLTPSLQVAIADSDIGHDVSYYLAKNPAEAMRIAQLPERQMVREITKLEAKVTEPPKPKLPQTLTQTRDARGQFADAAYSGMTPLSDILARK